MSDNPHGFVIVVVEIKFPQEVTGQFIWGFKEDVKVMVGVRCEEMCKKLALTTMLNNIGEMIYPWVIPLLDLKGSLKNSCCFRFIVNNSQYILIN